MNVEEVAERVDWQLDMMVEEVWSTGKYKLMVTARRLNISSTAVSKSVLRCEKLVRGYKHSIGNRNVEKLTPPPISHSII